jgi:hypothetical protein
MWLYTLKIWVVANILHPFIILLYFGFNDDEIINFGSLAFVLTAIFPSFLISIPSFPFARLLLALIKQLPFDTSGKFISWLLLVTVIPALNLFLLGLVLGEANILENDSQLFIPASISVVISVIIRYRQFFKLFNQAEITVNEINTDEQ